MRYRRSPHLSRSFQQVFRSYCGSVFRSLFRLSITKLCSILYPNIGYCSLHLLRQGCLR
ncbi:Uncharacterised protein [Vibrio cholerae]|nr:Uncharacterised protein [Vibrio cholerae]CSI62301.1 Uncharacterised protein [Vibrio cholerae]